MDNDAILTSDEAAHVDILQEEFKQAGVLPNGFYDIAFNQETRRMIWAGQAPDGRKWDENLPEGQQALPWNGCSDTRVPLVDGVVNGETAVHSASFDRAELRATAVDPDRSELASEVSKYLHWMVRTRYKRMLALETELSSQYSREHGFCVAFVGWERELGKRRVKVTLEQLAQITSQPNQGPNQGPNQSPPSPRPSPPGEGGTYADSSQAEGSPSIVELIVDPSREEEAVALMQSLYKAYVVQTLAGKGFYDDELDKLPELSKPAARRYVKELREEGQTLVAMPYVCKNQPFVWVGQPFLEILAARGTMELQRARAMFWRRWMTEAELKGKEAEGWDPTWIKEAVKTKGNMSTWAGALGATSLTGPSTKTIGNTTYLKVTEENNPLIEVIYGFVRKVDEEGVTAIYQTIFSPHLLRNPVTQEKDFCASHELLDYAHGRYPFVEMKRENIGRALTDSRSVGEIAGTWQSEEKKQRDMLFNRADWDTLPPVQVPKLGGVDYRLGPGAQVPMSPNKEIKGIRLDAPAPNLALELVKEIKLRTREYFGQSDPELDPALTAAKQAKSVRDFYNFWGEIFAHMFALTAQYNPEEIARVTGNPQLPQSLDPTTVLDEFDMGLEFDVAELNPDYVTQKMKAMNEFILPGDAGGVIDRTALTMMQTRMLDPKLAQKLVMDKGTAAQKVYDDTDTQVARMALGNEAKYVENDATAPMRLQYLQTIVANNPKYQQWLRADPRFGELMQNYAKNLQMSVMQQQNKTIGRIGVKQVGAGTGQ